MQAVKTHCTEAGMAYRFTDISVRPIYQHFLKYRLSVSVKIRTDEISAIGYRLWPNIGSQYRLNFGDFLLIYRQLLEYRLSVSVKPRTDKISVIQLIGNWLWLNIGNRLSAKFNRYAIPVQYIYTATHPLMQCIFSAVFRTNGSLHPPPLLK